MFESRFIDDPNRQMETLDRRMPGENGTPDVWVPMLSRPPISGTGHRVLENRMNNRRSCDLSNSTGVLLDNDDVRTDVNRNISDKLRSKVNGKKYHKKVSKLSKILKCLLSLIRQKFLKNSQNRKRRKIREFVYILMSL